MARSDQLKPTIALVVDVIGWAFSNIAHQLKKYLSDRFDIEIFPVEELGGVDRIYLLTKDFDLVHFFWRVHLVDLRSEQTARKLALLDIDASKALDDYFRKTAITSSVYDHLFLDDSIRQSDLAAAMKLLVAYSVSSRRLWNIYRSSGEYPIPSAVLQDGVDLSLFAPKNVERFSGCKAKNLIVGWAGNSGWSDDTEDFKGVHTFLLPVVEKLQRRGFPIELRLADRQIGLTPHEEMPDFYANLHVYICISKIEGTPNPILEAMACGVPIISTDVGVVPEVFGPVQRQFILTERSAEALEAALIKISDDWSLLKKLSEENVNSIQAWDWALQTKSFGVFFESSLAQFDMRERTSVLYQSGRIPGVSPRRNKSQVKVGKTVQWLRENVVICMLFYNKLEQTISSVESFLSAGVRVNILDNGSDKTAARQMRAHFSANQLVDVVDAGRNAGVSGGRNIQMRVTTAPWLFFVDNDISMQTADWISELADAMNGNPEAEIFAPRLFNKHEDAWGAMSDFVVDASGNCAFVATSSSVSNAFPGGASVISRSVFDRVGQYDEDLFVGFEDFELAIRAWKKRTPLFVQYVNGIILMHDHRISDAEADKQTARVRYDTGHIGNSHSVVHRKHGVLLDPNFNDWLNEQVRQLTGEARDTADSNRALGQHALHGSTVRPRFCGQSLRLLVLVNGIGEQAWLSLRSATQAAERARQSHVDVAIHWVGASDARLKTAVAAGLLHEADAFGLSDPTGEMDEVDAVCCLCAGLMTIDFLLQLAQRMVVDNGKQPKVYVPERTIWVSRSGRGVQLRRASDVDLLGLAGSEPLSPLFAFSAQLAQDAGEARDALLTTAAPEWLTRLAAQGYSGDCLSESAVVVAVEDAKVGALHDLVGRLNSGAPLQIQHAVWLDLEQENLREIALHQGIAATSWCALPLGTQRQGAVVHPAVHPVLDRLLDAPVAHVLVVPWLRRGGADRAALAYLHALETQRPGRVLLITTEPTQSSWQSRIPPGVRSLDWYSVADWGPSERARNALAWMLVRLRPASIHVMNSWLGWEMLASDGVMLRATSRIFASLFWYGPSTEKRLLGYATDYVCQLEHASAVDLYLTDNASFPLRMQQDCGVSEDRFRCVWHPTMDIVETAERPPVPDRPRVLWASRFAPEKRVDLLLSIAESCPEMRFSVYGDVTDSDSALLEWRDRLLALDNVTMGGGFDDFSELPINENDVFLYTSSSDGMPNVVIEAMARAMPVVASIVGGIGDLVDSTTGWPVHEVDDPTAYGAALRAALADSAGRWERSSRGLSRVRERHSFDSFGKQLQQIPGYLS